MIGCFVGERDSRSSDLTRSGCLWTRSRASRGSMAASMPADSPAGIVADSVSVRSEFAAQDDFVVDPPEHVLGDDVVLVVSTDRGEDLFGQTGVGTDVRVAVLDVRDDAQFLSFDVDDGLADRVVGQWCCHGGTLPRRSA
ncbi:hypothetical protein A6E15_01925 [Natrinema saccharevitans]|uniref:Uncharacterized protein n=1 Tax=Natrinema saccharevitans TaxID=301967 RepID=A0A1S8ATA9_9EURY|nr:hypothetical protein A6E15_01925 [Natrinema saccharevitans]